MCFWQEVTCSQVQKTTCKEGQKENYVVLLHFNEECDNRPQNWSNGVQKEHPQGIPERIARVQHYSNCTESISEVMAYDGNRDDYSDVDVGLKTEPDCQAIDEAVH
jgi:hypothetical protein